MWNLPDIIERNGYRLAHFGSTQRIPHPQTIGTFTSNSKTSPHRLSREVRKSATFYCCLGTLVVLLIGLTRLHHGEPRPQ